VPRSSEIGVPHDDLELTAIAITIAVVITIASCGSTYTIRGHVSRGKHLWDPGAGSGGRVHLERYLRRSQLPVAHVSRTPLPPARLSSQCR
jgi:hypothetical protein